MGAAGRGAGDAPNGGANRQNGGARAGGRAGDALNSQVGGVGRAIPHTGRGLQGGPVSRGADAITGKAGGPD